MKPRLLIITRNLPPLTGGMERLLFNAVIELADTHEVSVIGPGGCRQSLPANVKVHETFGTGMVGYLLAAVPLAIWSALLSRPQVILAGSGVTAPIARLVSVLFRVRYVVLVHGLDLIAPHKLYQALFLPCIRAADLVIANSSNTQRLAEAARVPLSRITVQFPGVEFPPKDPSQDFRIRFKLGNRKLILSVGRIVPRKGLARFIDTCMSKIIEKNPNTCLVIVGEEPNDALMKGDSESAAIDRAIKRRGLEAAVVRCGRLSDDLVSAAYHAAELFIFPVLDLPGDVEGFGMVVLEAAAFGLPTVGFRAGGLIDAVIDNVTGRLADPNDYQLLTTMVLDTLASDNVTFRDACRAHAERHRWETYGATLAANLKRLL